MIPLEPSRTAAVLIDMQGAVRHHSAEPNSPDEIIVKAGALVTALRAVGGLVVYVRTSFLPDESDSLRPPIDRPRQAPHRAQGWDQLVEEMQPLNTEPVVVKRSWNAFHGSDLDLQLRRHGIKTVIMAGISTNYGVEGTARAAFDHGYDLIFARDVMASDTSENHDFAVQKIFPQLGQVRDLEAISEALYYRSTPAVVNS